MSAGRKNISIKKDWCTPPKYVNAVRRFFGGETYLDPCDNKFSLTDPVVSYFENGLEKIWNFPKVFVNPPYGRDKEQKTSIYDWIKKGCESWLEFDDGTYETLFLIPVATNTRHFKEIIFRYAFGICFLEDTRLKFWSEGKEMKKGAPMACCIVYFGHNYGRFEQFFKDYGKCFNCRYSS